MTCYFHLLRIVEYVFREKESVKLRYFKYYSELNISILDILILMQVMSPIQFAKMKKITFLNYVLLLVQNSNTKKKVCFKVSLPTI